METKLQTATNQNDVIALEKYSELKQVILEKIAQAEDTEQVQKLTKMLFDIDKNVDDTYSDEMYRELHRKVYEDFLDRLRKK